MNKNTVIELSRCCIRVSHHQETQLSCSNSYIASLCEEGINVLNYSHNLLCPDKQIDHLRYYIPVSKLSPVTGLFKKFTLESITDSEMTEMVLDPTLWPHNKQLMEEATRYINVSWSPAGFMQNSDHVLAVLNSVGNVSFYIQNMHKWIEAFDLSSLVTMQFSEKPKVENNFDSIRKAAHSLATQSICWAPQINDDKSCYFVTVQRNGSILFWSLHPDKTNIQGKYLGIFDSGMGEIVNISWIHETESEFLLFCSEIRGKLKAFKCKIENNEVSVIEKYEIWIHIDQMCVKSILSFKINHYFIIVFSKNRHLIFQVYDEKMSLITQEIRKLNNYRITDILKSPDGLLVSTVNANIHKVQIDIVNNKLNIVTTVMEFVGITPSMELYSMCLTNNNLIYIIGMVDRKIKLRKEPDYIDIVFATTESNLENIMDTLLNNSSRKLTNLWDCIELLRYKIRKTKKMPELDYKELYNDGKSDVYKLKVYLMLLIFYTELGAMKNYYIKMPETSIDYVKEMLLVHHAISLICNVENNYHKNGMWSNNEQEYIIGAKKYLEFYCRKYKKNLDDLVNTSIFKDIKSNMSYTCQSCDKALEGFTCKDGHINMTCSLTFTPIISEDYLFCKACNITARTDVDILKPLCVFCDFRLYQYQ